ncbi:MAG: hypothetical protein Q9217_003407 [Psora testacea]
MDPSGMGLESVNATLDARAAGGERATALGCRCTTGTPARLRSAGGLCMLGVLGVAGEGGAGAEDGRVGPGFRRGASIPVPRRRSAELVRPAFMPAAVRPEVANELDSDLDSDGIFKRVQWTSKIPRNGSTFAELKLHGRLGVRVSPLTFLFVNLAASIFAIDVATVFANRLLDTPSAQNLLEAAKRPVCCAIAFIQWRPFGGGQRLVALALERL